MKYVFLLIIVLMCFILPQATKAQSKIKRERTDLDSLTAIFNRIQKSGFIYGIKQAPELTSTESNGATNWKIEQAQGDDLDSCLCHCYFTCKSIDGAMAFLRLDDLTEVTFNKSDGIVSLHTGQESMDMIPLKEHKTALLVYNLFGELINLCDK